MTARFAVSPFGVTVQFLWDKERAMQALTTRLTDFSALTRGLPALALLLFGAVMLYGVGFTSTEAVHNAAHDTRHATGFPCH